MSVLPVDAKWLGNVAAQPPVKAPRAPVKGYDLGKGHAHGPATRAW